MNQLKSLNNTELYSSEMPADTMNRVLNGQNTAMLVYFIRIATRCWTEPQNDCAAAEEYISSFGCLRSN